MKGGGAERVMCNLINEISKKKPDYEIDLIHSEGKGVFINEISPKINIDSAEILSFPWISILLTTSE